MKNSASFFDLDHTLLRVSSSYQFGIYLYRHKIFSTYKMLYLAGSYALHKIGIYSIAKLQHKIFRKLFLGASHSTFYSLAKSFLDEHFDQMLYLPAIERLKNAQRKGEFTVILSSSPDFIVGEFAKRLNVDAWAASRYTVDASHAFSCISHLLLSDDKAKYVADAGKQWKIERQRMTAYSDSILDLSFLESAGVAVAVNPDRALRALCKKNNWTIL